MIKVKKKGKRTNCKHLREANLCESSPMPKELVPEVGTLEDSNDSVIVHYSYSYPKTV